MNIEERLVGSLWGTALGDALGLCREGLSKRRGQRLYPDLTRYQLFGGRGLVSDDTDHAAFTMWALQQPEQFGPRLRWALCRWFWSLPAGIGLATLRSALKASVGVRACGVFSAGNGPLMRTPIIAAGGGANWMELLKTSTELTHTDPRAYQGALMVGAVTRYLCGEMSWDEVCFLLMDPYLSQHLRDMGEWPTQASEEFAAAQGWGQGVSGFVYHTAPVVVQVALRHRDDYTAALQAAINCGGDTDTTAAIVGGMLGARLGPSALPKHLLQAYADRPLGLHTLQNLATGQERDLPSYALSLARNLLFGSAILTYGLRRLLPPY